MRETFEVMKPRRCRVCLATNIAFGQTLGPGCVAGSKLKELGYDLADNQLNDMFVRFKDLADRKKEVFDDDLMALLSDQNSDRGGR